MVSTPLLDQALRQAMADQFAGRLDAPEPAYRQVLQMAPNHAECLHLLGILLHQAGQSTAGADMLRRSVRRQPKSVQYRNNLVVALVGLHRFGPAVDSFRAALRLQPDYPNAWFNLGTALGTLRDWDTADTAFRQALRLAPDDAEIHVARTSLLLLTGRLRCGGCCATSRELPVLLEQPPVPPDALHCPLTALPRIFGTALHTIPATVPYLSADPARTAMYRERLAALGGLSVGLAWGGNPQYKADRLRSMPVAQFARLAEVPGVTFVSLHKGAAAAQSAGAPLHLHNWMDEVQDLADTAAIVAALDLVVGVDASVVHLAGAPGKPVRLLNRDETDWRWLLDREDSPRYPTLRIFRQPEPGD